MTSQFAMRVAILGGMALIAFGVVFFRLWYLEVLSSEEYLQQAQANRVREIKVQAPRGQILDREGKLLVDNGTALSLQVRPDELPRKKRVRARVIGRLSEASGMPVKRINRRIRRQVRELPSSPVTLKRDVERELVYFLRERQDQFPGVTVEEVFVRDYPNGTLAAHLFGYVSEISEEQLEEPQYDGLEPGDRIGAAGVELQYDSALRGKNGAIRVQVDAEGRPRGRQLSEVEPETGNNLILTVDKKIQQAGEQALAKHGAGKPGAAFVVMNANDGAIIGMGSSPTFDPDVYTPPVSFAEIEGLLSDATQPLFSNAMQNAYPTGSTFKLITSVAALEEGLIEPDEIVADGGVMEFGGRTWQNAGQQAYGAVDMVRAIEVSSDIYYYKLGIESNQVYEGSDGERIPIQDWGARLGIGSQTGIDLPNEGAGLLPTPDWRNELWEEGLTDRPWSVGDSMNLAVGQGDLQASPLQLAVAYATIANGGSVVRPHVAQAVEDQLGQTVEEFTPAPRRELELAPGTRETIVEGLRRAAMEAGTSSQIFGDFPVEIAGKTGTAETSSGIDQSWYAAMAPADDPQIVAVATIEQGGFGAEAAAPAVRDILTAYFTEVGGIKAKKFQQAETEPAVTPGAPD